MCWGPQHSPQDLIAMSNFQRWFPIFVYINKHLNQVTGHRYFVHRPLLNFSCSSLTLQPPLLHNYTLVTLVTNNPQAGWRSKKVKKHPNGHILEKVISYWLEWQSTIFLPEAKKGFIWLLGKPRCVSGHNSESREGVCCKSSKRPPLTAVF